MRRMGEALGCKDAVMLRGKAECFTPDCYIEECSLENVREYFEGEQLKLIFKPKPLDPDNARLPNKSF